MEIKDVIKDARIKSGLTQEQAAEKILVTRQTISSWENGRSLPDIMSVLKMSDLYQISLDELLKGDKKMVEKIEKESWYLKERRKNIKFLIFSVIGLMLTNIYYLKLQFDTGFDIHDEMTSSMISCLVMTICMGANVLLLTIADQKKSDKYSKVAGVFITIVLIWMIQSLVFGLIEVYKTYGIIKFIGVIVLVLLITFLTVLISDILRQRNLKE